MTPERIAELRAKLFESIGADPLDWGPEAQRGIEALDALEQAQRERDSAEAECARLRAGDGAGGGDLRRDVVKQVRAHHPTDRSEGGARCPSVSPTRWRG